MILAYNMSTDEDESDHQDTLMAQARFYRILVKSLNKRLRKERKEKKANEVIQVIEEMKEAQILNLKNECKGKDKKKKDTTKKSKTKKEKKKPKQDDGNCSTDTDFKHWFSVGYVDYHKRQAAKNAKSKKEKTKKNKTKKKKNKDKDKKAKKIKYCRDWKDTSKRKKVMKDPILEAAKAELRAAEGSYNDIDPTETTANSSSGSLSLQYETLEQYLNRSNNSRKMIEDEISDITIDNCRMSLQLSQHSQDFSPKQPTRSLDKRPMSLPLLLADESDDSSESSAFDFFDDDCSYEGALSDDEMLDDLSYILENSERYFQLRRKATRWDSNGSDRSINSDSVLDEPLMTPMRTISTSFVQRCIPENEELSTIPTSFVRSCIPKNEDFHLTPVYVRKVVQILNAPKSMSCEF